MGLFVGPPQHLPHHHAKQCVHLARRAALGPLRVALYLRQHAVEHAPHLLL
jgi:hypothetical protein